MPNIPLPDLAQAQRHLAAIDPDPNARFGFRTIDDPGNDVRQSVKAYGTLASGVRQSSNPEKHGRSCTPHRLLAFMQQQGAGVFFAPNRLDGRGQLGANVNSIRVFYVDCDTRRQGQQLRAFIRATNLAPTLLVASGGVHEGADKLHAYWRVDGYQVADFPAAQLTLASRIGSDPAVKDAGRVMRLAGFWHLKGAPRQTRIIEQNDSAYDCHALLTRVQAQPEVSDPWAPRPAFGGTQVRRGGTVRPVASSPEAGQLRVHLDRHGGLLTPGIRAAIAEAQHGERHLMLRACISRLIQARWPDPDVHALILPAALAAWPDVDSAELGQRIDRLLGWIRGQEAAQLAAQSPLSPRAAALVRAFGGRA